MPSIDADGRSSADEIFFPLQLVPPSTTTHFSARARAVTTFLFLNRPQEGILRIVLVLMMATTIMLTMLTRTHTHTRSVSGQMNALASQARLSPGVAAALLPPTGENERERERERERRKRGEREREEKRRGEKEREKTNKNHHHHSQVVLLTEVPLLFHI